MDFRKLSFFSSMALLAGFMAKELLKAKIRAVTLAIRRSELEALRDDPAFKTLLFNNFYDNRTLAKDHLLLVAYKQTTEKRTGIMQPVDLERVDNGRMFDNERDYSAYKLFKEDLQQILDCFSKAPDFAYVLFRPVIFTEDNRYLAYQIRPANNRKIELPIPAPTPLAPQTLSSGEQHPQPVQTMHLMSSTGFGKSSNFQINPSPPAGMHFS